MDFNKITDRFHSDSCKWNVLENELPMWVADMDFEVAPEIIDAIQKRLNHKIFGYTEMKDELYYAYIKWWDKRHHFKIEREWLLFSTGVVPSISSIVRKLTSVGENVLLQAPVYNIFYNSIINNGRNVVSSDLLYVDGEYKIDWADLEEKLADKQTTLMILCNPHNPIGKIWDKETLAKIGKLCYDNNVLVLSDEIHCDLCAKGKEYVPFASVNEINKMNSITCISPTKAFNLAGFQTSMICVSNPVIRHKVWRGINTDEIAEANTFATVVPVAAFNECGYWLDELREYIDENRKYATTFIKEEIPDLKLIKADATYLLWIDCSKLTEDATHLCEFIREKTGLFVSNGYSYGQCGKTFIRVNIATQLERVKDGLNRLKTSINLYKIHKQ